MKSLIPLILFLSTVVLLTVFLTSTEAIRGETSRSSAGAERDDYDGLSLETGRSLIRFSSGEKRPGPAERLSLDRLVLDAAAALAEDDYETAIGNARTILIFDPQNYTALSVLGKSLFVTDRMKEAEVVFLHQTQFYPNDPVAFVNLGYSRAQLGKYQAALDSLQEALRLEPRAGEVLLSMAGICVMDNQKTRAVNYLQMAANRMGKKLLQSLEQPIFDGIRGEPGFEKIVRSLENNANVDERIE